MCIDNFFDFCLWCWWLSYHRKIGLLRLSQGFNVFDNREILQNWSRVVPCLRGNWRGLDLSGWQGSWNIQRWRIDRTKNMDRLPSSRAASRWLSEMQKVSLLSVSVSGEAVECVVTIFLRVNTWSSLRWSMMLLEAWTKSAFSLVPASLNSTASGRTSWPSIRSLAQTIHNFQFTFTLLRKVLKIVSLNTYRTPAPTL